MEIAPQFPLDNSSSAERKVFKAIKYYRTTDCDPKAFHSLLLKDHGLKRIGEADFVIVSTHGLFVLEVKGGRINVENRTWTTKNRDDVIETIQDPFKQAETAVHAINNSIKKFAKTDESRIPLGYGVVFPNTDWKVKGIEWDSEMICDKRDMADFQHWLDEFFDYWNNKRPNNKNLLSQSDIDNIAQYISPRFELVEPLFDRINFINKQVVRFTEDQYHFVTIAMANPRVICQGGAGTGKTFVAAELAKRLNELGKTTLLVCKSTWLKHYLSTRINNPNLTLINSDALSQLKRTTGISEYDVLIVDEGQDLLNQRDLQRLSDVVKGGFADGQWYFFHDNNNQANLLQQTEPDAIQILLDHTPTQLPLSTNCRNTQKILEHIQTQLGCDIGTSSIVEGPEVVHIYEQETQAIKRLQLIIEELHESSIDLGTVTILSPVQLRHSIVSKLPPDYLKAITVLDDYRVRSMPFEGISFAQVKDFKGLENDVIILVDLPPPEDIQESESKANHYVGMSRARALLYCFWAYL